LNISLYHFPAFYEVLIKSFFSFQEARTKKKPNHFRDQIVVEQLPRSIVAEELVSK
jgi:hypothetical protein